MRNIVRIYKVMLKHWGYLVFGLLAMLGYALFSGVSITLAIPLMDFVFKGDATKRIYFTFSQFWDGLSAALTNFSQQYNIWELFKRDTLNLLKENLTQVLTKTDPYLLLWMISITLISFIILKNLFFFAQKILFANLRGKTIRDVRNNIYRTYLYQSFAFFSKNKVGDSLVRMVSDVKIVSDMFIGSVFNSLRDIIVLLVFARIALFLNAKLFLISLVLLPIFSAIIHYLGNKIKKYSRRIQQQSSDMFSNVEEKINGIRIVKAFSRENYEMERFKQINQKHFKYWIKSQFYNSFNTPLSELNGTITGLVVLMIGGSQVLAAGSEFSFGSFVTFILAIFSMLRPMKTITKAYADIRKALVSLDRISEILNRDSEISPTSEQQAKKSFDRSIEFKNVNFSYDGKEEILQNINLTVNKGEKVALVGSSGSGKTTLVNLLERMYDVTAGKILIDGIPIENIKLHDLRNLFGTVTQESVLFADSIADNIRYGSLKKIDEKDIRKAAQIANADEFIEKWPEQYDKMLNPHGGNLSGGQKQRICIARAIVGNPPILIFDEATSALDTEAERNVQDAIDKATKNRTVIVIAHRLSTVLASDKIVVMDEGKIIDIGTHEELLQKCDRYKYLYELQFAD